MRGVEAAVVSFPTGPLREALERAAVDPALDPELRARALRDMAREVKRLAGQAETLAGEAELQAEARRSERVREDREIAEELVRRGMASEERLAELGLVEAFSERLHPRGRTGRFVRSLGGEGVSPTVRRTAVGGEWQAVGPDGELAVRPTRQEAQAAARGMERRATRGARPSAPESPGRVESPQEFVRDPDLVAEARRRVLSGRPTTRDAHATRVGGRVVYDAERRELHRRVVEKMIGEVRPPVGRAPRALFTGGGYASGKGGVVARHKDFVDAAVTIDPDRVKAELPEFRELTAAGDPEANLRTYEEAWDVAQELAAEVRSRGLDVVVDGVGDYSADEVVKRAQSYVDAGYDPPHAVYVSKPTEEAIADARARLEGAIAAGKLESQRWIPPDLMWDTHARVSRTLPEIASRWPGTLELFRTYQFDRTVGRFPDARRVMSAEGGEVRVLNAGLWDEFLEKGRDAPRLSEAAGDDEPPPGVPVYVPFEWPAPVPPDEPDGDGEPDDGDSDNPDGSLREAERRERDELAERDGPGPDGFGMVPASPEEEELLAEAAREEAAAVHTAEGGAADDARGEGGRVPGGDHGEDVPVERRGPDGSGEGG